MKYAKKNATPEQAIEASIALHEAAEKVRAALNAINGTVKVSLLDGYVELINRLKFESMRLEDDFADLVAAEFKTPARSVPLFGSRENLERAAAHMRALREDRGARL